MRPATLATFLGLVTCTAVAADTVTVAGVAQLDGTRMGGVEVMLCGSDNSVGCPLATDRTSETGVYNLIATNIIGVPTELVVIYSGDNYKAKPVMVRLRPPRERVREGRASDLLLLRPPSGVETTSDEVADTLEAEYLTVAALTRAGKLDAAGAKERLAANTGELLGTLQPNESEAGQLFDDVAERIGSFGVSYPSREEFLQLARLADPPSQVGPSRYVGPTTDQQAMLEAWRAASVPGSEHANLAALAGTYKLTVRSWSLNASEPERTEAVAERSLVLGGRVLEERITAQMMGMPFEGIGQIGYDNLTDKYWLTWTDNMTTALSVYYGTMKPDGSLSFKGTMVDPMAGAMIDTRIEIHRVDDKEIQEFFVSGVGGVDVKVMEAIYEPVP